MKSKINSENIIVAIIMVVIILFSVVVIGVEPIKVWLDKPIIWDEPDYLDVSLVYVGKNGQYSDDELILKFAIENSSDYFIKEYEILTEINGVEITLNQDASYYTSERRTIDKKSIAILDRIATTNSVSGFYSTTFNIDEKTYNELLYGDLDNIKLSYKTVSLYDGDKYLINNNGTFKIILIVIISAVLGAIGIFWAKEKWLRILLKVCGLPAVLIIILVALIVLIGSRSGGGQGETSGAFKSAQERYKNAASHKAGHLQHGNTAEAAKAQAQMDSAMADMIGSSSNNSNFRSAQERYKRAAAHKAGHLQHGNTADAARAQAEMDRAMADMMKYK